MMESTQRRTHSKINIGNLYWKLDYDVTERALYVYFSDGEPERQFVSADENYIADAVYDDDDVIRVLGVEILDPIRVGVIEEWIREAVELALAEYDDYAKDDFQWQGDTADPTIPS